MPQKWDADQLVEVRSENVDRYKRSFLRQAVCEFRFPTLFELGGPQPPASFVNALRKEYPHLELANEVTLGVGGSQGGTSTSHVFRSAKLNWSVSLKPSAFSIETTSYTDYAQMRERVLHVVDAASKIIDSDFFTRIGLRYINVVKGDEEFPSGWINEELVAPISSKRFLGIHEFAGKIVLTTEDGGCLFQHGLRVKKKDASDNDDQIAKSYVVDIDSFRNEVVLADTADALDSMHTQAFELFDWALGPKARDHLSSEKR